VNLPKSVIPIALLIVFAVTILLVNGDSEVQSYSLFDMSSESVVTIEIVSGDNLTKIEKKESGYLLSGTLNDMADNSIVDDFIDDICKLEIIETLDIESKSGLGFGKTRITVSDGNKKVTCSLGKMNPVNMFYYIECSNRSDIAIINSELVSLLEPVPFVLRQKQLFGNNADDPDTIKVQFPDEDSFDVFVKRDNCWWLDGFSGDDKRLGKVVSVRRDIYGDRVVVGAYLADENLIKNLLYTAGSAKVKSSSNIKIEPIKHASIIIGSTAVNFSEPESDIVECWRNSNPYSLIVNKKVYDYAFGGLEQWLHTGVTTIDVSDADSMRVSLMNLQGITAINTSGNWLVGDYELENNFSDLALELERIEIVEVLKTDEFPLTTFHGATIEIWSNSDIDPVILKFSRSHDDSKYLCMIEGVTVEVDSQILTTLRTLYSMAGLWN
jgi:hypothetical protein